MSTLSYSPLASKQSSYASTAGSLATTSQSIQSVGVSARRQSSSSAQLVPSTHNNSQLSQSPSGSTNFSIPTSSQPASHSNPQSITPNKSLPPKKDSPGAWKHPRAEEIARRQRASTFGADNISLINKSVAALAAVEILRRILPNFIWRLLSPISHLTGSVPLWAFWGTSLIVIAYAFWPLWTGPDQLLDIDLNATQRSLLGLDPNATPPATPATKYVTPPKYTRSATPRSGTPGSRGSSPAGSPLNYKDNSGYRRSSDSFSSSRRASFGSNSRRQSFGLSASVFGTPSKEGSIFAPQTPSPIGRGSGIPFSNKWLYHKGTSMSRDSF